jgi:hypothetical protein
VNKKNRADKPTVQASAQARQTSCRTILSLEAIEQNLPTGAV